MIQNWYVKYAEMFQDNLEEIILFGSWADGTAHER